MTATAEEKFPYQVSWLWRPPASTLCYKKELGNLSVRIHELCTRVPAVSCHSTSIDTPNNGRPSDLFQTCRSRFEPLGAVKGMHSFLWTAQCF